MRSIGSGDSGTVARTLHMEILSSGGSGQQLTHNYGDRLWRIIRYNGDSTKDVEILVKSLGFLNGRDVASGIAGNHQNLTLTA